MTFDTTPWAPILSSIAHSMDGTILAYGPRLYFSLMIHLSASSQTNQLFIESHSIALSLVFLACQGPIEDLLVDLRGLWQ